MVRSIIGLAKKIKTEQLSHELSKFSSDSDSDSQSQDSDDRQGSKKAKDDDDSDSDSDSDSEEEPVKPVVKKSSKLFPSKVEKPKSSKKSKALEKVKAMDLGTPSKKSSSKSSTPLKLKDVPSNYFSADYKSPKPSSSKSTPKSALKKGLAGSPRSVPVILHQRKDNVRITLVKTNADGTQESYVFGSVPRTTLISQLIFNLPESWKTRRSDVYSVKGELIENLEESTLLSLGLKDGDVIDSVSRGTSG
ncbi:hypothetical protein CJU90_0758 [Yarrowia sp. C11]|nr:hypothetical protein CKK34_2170 [Yarrowia sp. E02]KAG5373086.1 hypothetical protein CJU90_0758 [Yarrowia sp. C11]